MAENFSLAATFTADTTRFEQGVRRVNATMQSTGRLVARGAMAASAAITGIGVASVKLAGDFEASMRNVQSVTHATNAEIAQLSKEVLSVGRDFAGPGGPRAVAESFFDISSAVQDASKRIPILTAAVTLSEAGMAQLKTTSEGVINAMNAYSFSAEQAGFVTDVYARTVAKGVGTMDQFVAAMSPVLGLMASAGVEFEEVGAAIAFMTSKGSTASMASTQLKAATVALLKPNQDMARALRMIGVESGDAALAQFGLVGTLQRLDAALGGSNQAMAEVLGSTEALQASVVLTNEEFGEFFREYEEGLDGAAAAARRMQLQSFQAKWNRVKSQIQGVAIQLGGRLLPVLSRGADLFADFLNLLDRVDPKLLDLVVAAGVATVAVGGLAAAFVFLASPIGAVAIAAGAVVAAIGGLVVAYERDLAGIRTFTEREFGGVIRFFEDATAAAEKFFDVLLAETPEGPDMSFGQGPMEVGGQARARITVAPGDTIWDISRAEGIPMERLFEAFGVEDARLLQPGVYELPIEGRVNPTMVPAGVGVNVSPFGEGDVPEQVDFGERFAEAIRAAVPGIADAWAEVEGIFEGFSDVMDELGIEPVVGAIALLAGGFILLSGTGGGALAILGGIGGAGGGLIGAMGSLALGIAGVLGPMGLLILALAGLGVAYHANLFGFRDTVNSVMSDVKEKIDAVTGSLATLLGLTTSSSGWGMSAEEAMAATQAQYGSNPVTGNTAAGVSASGLAHTGGSENLPGVSDRPNWFDTANQQIGEAAQGRQFGGQVMAGQAVMVGEAGPELFIPNTNGMVMPNDQLTSASRDSQRPIVIQQAVFEGVQNPRELYEKVMGEARRRR